MRRRLLVLALGVTFLGCTRDMWQRSPGPDDVMDLVPWFSNMRGPGLAIQPYKMLRLPPEGAVPIEGFEAPLQVIPDNFPAIDALENPTQRTAESLDAGEKYFVIFCQPCHGQSGAGDGPVNAKLFIAPSLLTERSIGLSDGMIYSIIRHGRGAMRPYGHGVRGMDRWHVVNYVRQLQGAVQ